MAFRGFLVNRLDQLRNSGCDLCEDGRIAPVGLDVAAVHLYCFGHGPWRQEADLHPHVFRHREKQARHGAGLIDNYPDLSRGAKRREGGANLPLRLIDLRVEEDFARLCVDGDDVVSPLPDIDAAAYSEFIAQRTPSASEELAIAKAPEFALL